jgi:hypothetical protein
MNPKTISLLLYLAVAAMGVALVFVAVSALLH